MARARRLADVLLKTDKNIVLVPHQNADVDAVASAFGLYIYLTHRGKKAFLCFPSVSSQAKSLLEKLEIQYGAEVLEGFIVGVDASSEEMLPVKPDMYFDHHPSSPFAVKAPSCSELVAELLLEDGINHGQAYEALACGIYTDTAGLSSAEPQTLRILSELLEKIGATMNDVLSLLEEKREISESIAKIKALRRARIYRYSDFLLVVTSVRSFESSAAGISISAGADMAFAVGRERTIGRERPSFFKETGVSVLDVFKELGVKCGGHELAAGTHEEVIPEAIPEAFERALKKKGFSGSLKEY